MPLRPDEVQDGQDYSGAVFKKFQGLNNVLPPERLQPENLSFASNVDIDNSLALRMRKGFSQIKTGSFHSLWASPTGQFALVVMDGNLVILYPDYTTSAPIASNISSDTPLAFVTINGVVYYSNGLISGAVQYGEGRSWGLQPPPPPAASLSTGNLTPGTYTYCATYVRSDGQESGNSNYGSIIVTAGKTVTFNISPPVDPAVTRVRIYMTHPNGEALYRAIESAYNVTQVAFSGQAELLSVPLRTQDLTQFPGGAILGLASGRILAAQGPYLFYTEPFAYELYQADKNYLQYDSDISIVAPVNEGVFVATQNATYFHEGFDISKSTMVQKAVYGGIPGTLAYVDAAFLNQSEYTGKVAIWTSPQGIVTAGNQGFIKGVFRNLTQNFLKINQSLRGAAAFISQEGINKYVSLLEKSSDSQNTVFGDVITAEVVRNGQLISY